MGIGFKELLVILIVVLLIFGAKRLRNVGSDLGEAIKGFRRAVKEDSQDSQLPSDNTNNTQAEQEKTH
jgi:sec-independent protein translocase protein TatA